MKKNYIILLTIFLTQFSIAQIVTIPDANFKAALIEGGVDTNNDGEIQVTEAEIITSINVSYENIISLEGINSFVNLTSLDASFNQVASIDISELVTLDVLDLTYNRLTSIDLIDLTNLTSLELSSNQLTSIDVTELTSLSNLNLSNNHELVSLDASNLVNLDSLYVSYNQSLTSIDVSGLINLTILVLVTNQLSSIDVSDLTSLTTLSIVHSQLTSIDISNLTNLTNLNIISNQLTSIDVSGLTNLSNLNLGGNQLSSLDVSDLVNLTTLGAQPNHLTNINVSGLTNLEVLELSDNQFTSIDLSGLTSLSNLEMNHNQFATLDLSGFGLENLSSLEMGFNQLTSINLSGLTSLSYLTLVSNELTVIDVSSLISLSYLSIEANQFTSIEINDLENLTQIQAGHNTELTNLDVSGLENLTELRAHVCQLTNINISGLINLEELYVRDNQLTDIDVSGSTSLSFLDVSINPLITLNIKNGTNSDLDLRIDYDNTLEYICVDEDYVSIIQQEIDNAQTSTIVNSYCSFIPGGDFYVIEGHNTLDIDSNDCNNNNNNDGLYPNLQYSITDGTVTGGFISNDSGDYSSFVQEGLHTITPILENPTYFSISPTTFTVNFPVDTSPFIQDFCITPLGDFSDLEVSIIPLDAARPGFDADYKIIYKNKGTTILNGSVELAFQDIFMDLVSATPTVDEQVQSLLKWNYTNLGPLESRNIFVTMNINTPTDIPPVNGDDILMFEASINPIISDETPNDNVVILNQTVVNSYDPNDKTCIEGKYISPTYIGEYLHYVIRFENTGTATAINVVVKDIIDTSKFDISSLTPTDGSHSFITRIKDTNVVEFVFENIQLPFDDANNDGYITFKIKTLPTLQLDDIIENNAEIYFDFNAPIITNTSIVEIAENSSTEEFSSNTISIYPNPSNKQLIINSKADIDTISIFDINGRLLSSVQLSYSLSEYELDISKLSQGIYFLEIQSSNKKEVRKFIKK